MFSNTANSSASDNVNTRPKLKAYLSFISSKLRGNEQKIALAAGYVLTAGLFFGLGQYYRIQKPPEIAIEEPAIDLTNVNNNLNLGGAQFVGEPSQDSQVAGAVSDDLNCEGRIKGNISAKSKIYHMPGGAFYKRTVPEVCFNTEAEAKTEGFRKSQR